MHIRMAMVSSTPNEHSPEHEHKMNNPSTGHEQRHESPSSSSSVTEGGNSKLSSYIKLTASALLLYSSIQTYQSHHNHNHYQSQHHHASNARRRLSAVTGSINGNEHKSNGGSGNVTPSYMKDLMGDLQARQKLFDDTPPEEVKYWFEYTGPLQKYFYRYSRSRSKADYFEGRDDSGVLSARYVPPGGGTEFQTFYNTPDTAIPKQELPIHYRLLDNCFAMGSSNRPDLNSWKSWFGQETKDRCRILITMNMVGAGKGSTMLWETEPPPIHASNPQPWQSEQETAAMHLERNLKEMDAMCATGMIAIRFQMLVCEPIPGIWTDWIDSMLPSCGGSEAPFTNTKRGDESEEVEERPSPAQVVVISSAANADTCHNLKSGFTEKRVQDLILAPPYLTGKANSSNSKQTIPADYDPAIKTTHRDLVSSDDHDLYIGMKWSSLVSIRSVSAFLQASADVAAAAASPRNEIEESEENADGVTVKIGSGPSSPFLIPSFVRVSYVSEENNKVAKWRMHGDFFHPAAWEICKDSFDMTWIPDSISGNGGINGVCYDKDSVGYANTQKRLKDGEDCGQWWVYLAEVQMPLAPEVYANEVSTPIVQGGSNHFWMLTEIQRKEIVKHQVCEYNTNKECGENPQAIMPLGDLESFEINYMPNSALGRKHTLGRRPGYSKEAEYVQDRELVRERKQLKGQEEIEKALFDYTVYPAALFRKDATIKAARARDALMTKKEDIPDDSYGPYTVKSSYYDVTIKKPRPPVSGWCAAIARKGLCALYGEYFRESTDKRCIEACGLDKNFSKIVPEKVTK